MLERVTVNEQHLNDYRPIVGDDVVEELFHCAKDLKDARVLHINATAFGGGVAEVLSTLVPLMRDIGLDVEWQIIKGSNEFF